MFDPNLCELRVHNPSSEWRWGPVTLFWEDLRARLRIKVEPEDIVLSQGGGEPLPCQVDDIDPSEPGRKTLVFSLRDWVLPAQDEISASTAIVTVRMKDKTAGYYSSQFSNSRASWKDPELKVEAYPRGIKLMNSRLSLYLNLDPVLDLEEDKCYSGSVTSALLDNQEILDANRIFTEHAREKRCMQLDYIELMRPPWDWELYEKESLINKKYHLISKSDGPVRACVTIASDVFPYGYLDPFTNQNRQLDCRLYRVISLYAGQQYVVEELFVKGIPAGSGNWNTYVNPHFAPHYFSYVSYFHDKLLDISRYDNVPDWFTVSNRTIPFLGYGFATDRHTSPISNPDPEYPHQEEKTKSFSWRSFYCQYVTSVHLFMHYLPKDYSVNNDGKIIDCLEKHLPEAHEYFRSMTGKAWHELILKPLWVSIAG